MYLYYIHTYSGTKEMKENEVMKEDGRRKKKKRKKSYFIYSRIVYWITLSNKYLLLIAYSFFDKRCLEDEMINCNESLNSNFFFFYVI